MMLFRTMIRAVVLAVVLLLSAAPATSAQQRSSQDEFVPVDQLGDVQEQIPAGPLVAAAYGIAWAVVLVYVWSIWRRLQRVERELAEVNRRISGAPHG